MNESNQELTTGALRRQISLACNRIAPLWPLADFVAVNPLLGLSNRHFLDAAQLVRSVGHGELLMPASYFREPLAQGTITDRDVQTANQLAGITRPEAWTLDRPVASRAALQQALAAADKPETAPRQLTFAEFADARQGTDWAGLVVEEISKWCSVYYDQGQSTWHMPWQGWGLLPAWREAAGHDANPALLGLTSFHSLVKNLPESAELIIVQALERLGVPPVLHGDFLHRQLFSVAGWSSFAQYRDREAGATGQPEADLAQLLAIRLVYDLSVFETMQTRPEMGTAWQAHLGQTEQNWARRDPDLLVRYVAQLAAECAGQHRLLAKLKKYTRRETPAPVRKTLQAIFCIDVRSEVIRRALEEQSTGIETIGFAGFFGMACEHVSAGAETGPAQCPVLLKPQFKVRETWTAPDHRKQPAPNRDFSLATHTAWQAFKTSAVSGFAFVETAGFWSGIKLLKETFGLGGKPPETGTTPRPALEVDLTIAQQTSIAAGTLRNLGLIENFGRWVLFCGHGSKTANNPYAAALDCGACGGHAGGVNARVAADIFNHPQVRQALHAQGLAIPEDTIFIAGQHNTTTDEVVLYEPAGLTAQRQTELAEIKGWLANSSGVVRRERSESLGLRISPKLDRQIATRSRDWSEVRPEWGLAGNHAFIAAPRERTRGLNLEGRVFLHNYQPARDPDRGVLQLIMIAPMVVASWINLQYYASTVDNHRFGSGTKTLHNVVGTLGIWQGNGGDLQTGLPWQSVHDGQTLRHEPVRLTVIIEATRANLDLVMQAQAEVRNLVANGWVHLFALEPDSLATWRCVKPSQWQRVEV